MAARPGSCPATTSWAWPRRRSRRACAISPPISARKAIRVNALSAGPMRTLAGAGISDARTLFHYQQRHAPMRRSPTLDEVGGAALYLLSDLSGAVTGRGAFRGLRLLDHRHAEPDVAQGDRSRARRSKAPRREGAARSRAVAKYQRSMSGGSADGPACGFASVFWPRRRQCSEKACARLTADGIVACLKHRGRQGRCVAEGRTASISSSAGAAKR